MSKPTRFTQAAPFPPLPAHRGEPLSLESAS
ncbi:MAG: hypothetical protein ACI8RZ_007996 [Myxococcota bacterium]|jgi:hypothetical protein